MNIDFSIDDTSTLLSVTLTEMSVVRYSECLCDVILSGVEG